MQRFWILVTTQANRERWAAENIQRQGCKPYIPKYMDVVSRRRGRKDQVVKEAVIKPLFPRYVFVLTRGPWRFLLGTFGVTSVILAGNAPARVPLQVIKQLKQRENKEGIVELPKRPRHNSKQFDQGQEVRVKDGPFTGFIGIYQGTKESDREKVLLNIFGRRTVVFIGDECLEIA